MLALLSSFLAVSGLVASSQAVPNGRNGEVADPHRPACTTTQCRRIRSYLKQHYCGEPEAGNGPDEECDLRETAIRARKDFGARLKVRAEPQCEWDADGNSACHQSGEPRAELRRIALREMRRLGLPDKHVAPVYFTVWESPATRWSLVQAHYSHVVGSELSICEVILLMRPSSKIMVLREVRFHKTDADVPTSTTWDAIDVIDIDGDGQPEVVLEGDAYENHWLEVLRIEDGSVKTVFSGLGYWL
jgi:hypothetical protein